MNVEQIKNLVTQKSGRLPQTYNRTALDSIGDLIGYADVAEYLMYCLPAEAYWASGVRVLTLGAIGREMGEASAPGSFIRPFGYVIIANSAGGNVVAVRSVDGHVFWADHDSFSNSTIMFQDRATEEWEYLHEYSEANVEKAMVQLSDNVESFLRELLEDRLKVRLDSLD